MKIIVLFILLIMSIQDYKTKEVSNLLFIPFLFYIKINLIIIVLISTFLLFYKYIERYIGGADIKLFIVFIGIFSLEIVINWLFISSLIALIYLIIKRQKEIRFFPCMFLSYILVIL
ncbi:MAG: hypothetical protein LBR40_05370 [Bacilli bacterium]|jgi:prepilin signal peptidase PulO-like enzyme (type II secretory pathway)|nr:hypothetical protein [Bacilli bacterium]